MIGTKSLNELAEAAWRMYIYPGILSLNGM